MSYSKNFSLDKTSSEENNFDKYKIRRANTYEYLRDNGNREIQLTVEKYFFKPIWKNKSGDYL